MSNALSIVLAQLTQALDDPAIELAHEVEVLVSALQLAVPSHIGLTMSVTTDFGICQLDLPLRPWTVATQSSLHLELAPLSGLSPVGLTLHASKVGAFTDLIADIAERLDLSLAAFAVDEHLDEDDSRPQAMLDLADLPTLNWAVGVLIDRGDTPGRARAALIQSAVQARSSLIDAALAVLDSAKNTDEPPPLPTL